MSEFGAFMVGYPGFVVARLGGILKKVKIGSCLVGGPGAFGTLPRERGCVRRTSRSKCGCPESLSCPKTPGLAVPLRLVLRTQPRSVPVLLVVVSRWARGALRRILLLASFWRSA